MKPNRCLECGEYAVVPTAKAGRVTRYKSFHSIEIPADVNIPTCGECGTEWFDGNDALMIDEALEKVYNERLSTTAVDKLKIITKQGVSRQRIESAFGLSQGYISKVMLGKKIPSEHLTVSLAIIAKDISRLDEAERVWVDMSEFEDELSKPKERKAATPYRARSKTKTPATKSRAPHPSVLSAAATQERAVKRGMGRPPKSSVKTKRGTK